MIVIISLELTRVNPDRNIFSINVELTSTFFSLPRFGPSPSPNFKSLIHFCSPFQNCNEVVSSLYSKGVTDKILREIVQILVCSHTYIYKLKHYGMSRYNIIIIITFKHISRLAMVLQSKTNIVQKTLNKDWKRFFIVVAPQVFNFS